MTETLTVEKIDTLLLDLDNSNVGDVLIYADEGYSMWLLRALAVAARQALASEHRWEQVGQYKSHIVRVLPQRSVSPRRAPDGRSEALEIPDDRRLGQCEQPSRSRGDPDAERVAIGHLLDGGDELSRSLRAADVEDSRTRREAGGRDSLPGANGGGTFTW